MVKTTRKQREAIHKIWQRWYGPGSSREDEGVTYRELRDRLQPGMGWVAVVIDGLYIGIEPDGYTHT